MYHIQLLIINYCVSIIPIMIVNDLFFVVIGDLNFLIT